MPNYYKYLLKNEDGTLSSYYGHMKYTIGEATLIDHFNPETKRKDGIYFTDGAPNTWFVSDREELYVVRVGGIVKEGEGRYKTNMILVERKATLEEYLACKGEAFTSELDAVNRNGLYLQYIGEEVQTEEICLAAVRQNGLALKYVKDQTNKICLEAVEKTGGALQYVENQTNAICSVAVNKNIWNLKHVKILTDTIWLTAVAKNRLVAERIWNEVFRGCETEQQESCANLLNAM